MSDPVCRNLFAVVSALLVAMPAMVSAQEPAVITGQNINMVSGTTWPDGDPFLQRQNEGSLAWSSRDLLTMLAGSNDYRTVDLPGLPDEKSIGDSWPSFYRSNDGGGRWTSSLMPGYPQDNTAFGVASPLKGYDAGADPVVRAGTHGLFYYSGIVFNRGANPPSAAFVTTFVDLNNNERGNSIGIVRTTLYDENTTGSFFIDKPWIETDKPRSGATVRTLDVITDDGSVIQQTVECGNLYAVWARVVGDGTLAVSSEIMFARSIDCGETFSAPLAVSGPNTINQGASVSVNPVDGGIQIVWRQFENATMNCTRRASFWRRNAEEWPLDELEIAGYTVQQTTGGRIIVQMNDDDDNMDPVQFDDEVEHEADRPNRLFRQLIAAWLNVLSGASDDAIAATLAEAEAWLVHNPMGTRPSFRERREGRIIKHKLRRYNAGRIGPGRCDTMHAGGLSGLNPNAIMVVTSDDFGQTFTAPASITGGEYSPFEQGTTEYSFRTTGFPSMVFDGDGRSYVAYASRGYAVSDPNPVGGDARIVVTTSMDGASWTMPQPIDESTRPGHQMQPALATHRGYVFALYYDFREDIAGVFDRFIVDLPVDPTVPRHSADVRIAQALTADVPVFTDYSVLDTKQSTQTSRYPYLILNDALGDPQSVQMLYNPPNLPMFKGGTVPFFGDYIDLAASRYYVDATGVWQYDLDPARGAADLQAMWTDNRDVIGPPDGNWASYVPPGDGTSGPSLFDPGLTRAACSPLTDPTVVDRTKMRNQNVYTASITQGVKMSIPGNNRELDTVVQRVFVVFIQNTTDLDRAFRLEIDNQPVGGTASFEQFSFLDTRDEVVERHSSVSRSVYVTSSNASQSITLRATEIDEFGVDVPGGLTAVTTINPDPSAPVPGPGNLVENYTPAVFNPAVFNDTIFDPLLLGNDPNVGIYSPAVFNPAMFNSAVSPEFVKAALAQLAYLNPAVFNPAVFNLAVLTSTILNPAVFNQGVLNTAILSPAVFNPAVFNINPLSPAVFNPAVFNPAVFNGTLVETVETSVVIKNTGNTTAAYSLNLDLDNPPPGFVFQVMVYKTYTVPTVDGCTLDEIVEQLALVNELTPDVNGSLLNPDSTTFHVAPGDHVVATVRVIPDSDPATPSDPSTVDELGELNLSLSVVPQAVDPLLAAMGETEPRPVIILAPSLPALVITTTTLANGLVGSSYSTTLTTSGGRSSSGPITWELVPGSALPPGLTLTSGGQMLGTPTTAGTTNFDVRAKDDDQVTEQSLSLTIDMTATMALSLRADFDMSSTPAGPYSCLRTIWQFGSNYAPGDTITVNLFDSDFGPSIGTSVTTTTLTLNNIAYETFMPVQGLGDGIGYLTADFSSAITLSTLNVQGVATCTTPSTPMIAAEMCLIDQAHEAAPTGGVSIPALSPVGQTFIPTTSSMDTLDLYLNLPSGGTSGIVFVNIRQGDIITGTIVGSSGSLTVNNLGAPVRRYRFRFAAAVALTPGNTYAIEVVHSSGATVGVWSNGIGGGTYPGGTQIRSGVALPGEDLSFRLGTCLP